MQEGWIYVLVNSSIPGLVKVGRTTRPPAERVAELSGATGVATPFVLAFDQPVADSGAAERAVHAELDRRGLRVAPNREFFRGSPSEIVRVVLEAAEAGGPVAAPRADHSAASLLAAAERCLFGLGDTLQDGGEALRLYKLAAGRGALSAFERLGQLHVHIYLTRRDKASRRRALSALKDGARRGNVFCYAEMATLFAAERHLANFSKAWGLCFGGIRNGAPDAAAISPERITVACCRYLAGCLELGLAPRHLDVLAPASGAMVTALQAERAALRGREAERLRVVRVLRWVHQNLPLRASPPRAENLDSAQACLATPDLRGAWCPGQAAGRDLAAGCGNPI